MVEVVEQELSVFPWKLKNKKRDREREKEHTVYYDCFWDNS